MRNRRSWYLCSGREKLTHRSAAAYPGSSAAAADLRDVLTLQVLHSHVADLPDKFLPLEPVCPAASSHLESRREPQGPWKDHSQSSPGWRRRRRRRSCCCSGQERAIVQPVGPEPCRHAGGHQREGASSPADMAAALSGFLPGGDRGELGEVRRGRLESSRSTWLVFLRWEVPSTGKRPHPQPPSSSFLSRCSSIAPSLTLSPSPFLSLSTSVSGLFSC